MEPEPQARGSPWLGVLVAVCVVALACVGYVAFKASQRPEDSGVRKDLAGGFNVDHVAAQAPTPAGQLNPAARYATRSSPKPIGDAGLAMARPDAGATAPPGQSRASKSWREIALQEEPKITKIWHSYKARFPSIRAYEREWMSKPDLKAVTKRYHADHDPAAFVAGLANSKNFYKLIVKHINQPGMAPMFQEDISAASPEAHEKANESFQADQNFRDFVNGLEQATGIPLASMMGEQKVSEQDVINSMMKKAASSAPRR